ncbi:unnamed protein product [Dovyalis caffra]|uniref:Fringe n=1 Tax=Dovyalis caffra TaxID=77055 RepID=A0AAV1RK58_9ROSI|nr:unnamed protein product [Dovyalis caffra]
MKYCIYRSLLLSKQHFHRRYSSSSLTLYINTYRSSQTWNERQEYLKSWWRPGEMRGAVWMEQTVKNGANDHLLPPIKISSDVSHFQYENPTGDRSALRLTRIVSETLKLDMEDVRWFVMGDDDTLFFPYNLVRVLSKYDHNQYYYIGSTSESHKQNIVFNSGMAYGGGGFAISYPLAKALAKMQDRCIERYPGLYGSDDRIHACMSELGVPLTKEPGFHQNDFYGDIFGFLAAHPITPLVSLHHFEKINPIIPRMERLQALEKLRVPAELDSAALMQQSICYDKSRNWTVSVSWGYAVQIFRGIFYPREIETIARTFWSWYQTVDPEGFAFSNRPYYKHVCYKPFVHFISNASYNSSTDQTLSEYVRRHNEYPPCDWKMADPLRIDRVEVRKRPNPYLWDGAPRRNCCRSLPTEKNDTLVVNVAECREDEVIEVR